MTTVLLTIVDAEFYTWFVVFNPTPRRHKCFQSRAQKGLIKQFDFSTRDIIPTQARGNFNGKDF